MIHEKYNNILAVLAQAFQMEESQVREAVLRARSGNEKANLARLQAVFAKAARGEKITVAGIGGSITEGTGITVADGRAEKCWAGLMAAWWNRMFPGQVTFVNAGISGTSSNFGLHRLEADVLSHDPDLLFIEFAANDGAAKGSIRSCQEALILKMLERVVYTQSSIQDYIGMRIDIDDKVINYNTFGKYFY